MDEYLTMAQVLELLRSESEANRAAWARDHAASPSYVGDVLAGRRLPGPSLLKALGLERVELFIRKIPNGQTTTIEGGDEPA